MLGWTGFVMDCSITGGAGCFDGPGCRSIWRQRAAGAVWPLSLTEAACVQRQGKAPTVAPEAVKRFHCGPAAAGALSATSVAPPGCRKSASKARSTRCCLRLSSSCLQASTGKSHPVGRFLAACTAASRAATGSPLLTVLGLGSAASSAAPDVCIQLCLREPHPAVPQDQGSPGPRSAGCKRCGPAHLASSEAALAGSEAAISFFLCSLWARCSCSSCSTSLLPLRSSCSCRTAAWPRSCALALFSADCSSCCCCI